MAEPWERQASCDRHDPIRLGAFAWSILLNPIAERNSHSCTIREFVASSDPLIERHTRLSAPKSLLPTLWRMGSFRSHALRKFSRIIKDYPDIKSLPKYRTK